MSASKARRVTRRLTVEQRRHIAAELPELTARDQMRREAREEPTLSGEIRRAIHSSNVSLSRIAAHAHISPAVLDDFLTGERTLRSDVLDRLATILGFQVTR